MIKKKIKSAKKQRKRGNILLQTSISVKLDSSFGTDMFRLVSSFKSERAIFVATTSECHVITSNAPYSVFLTLHYTKVAWQGCFSGLVEFVRRS